jgi:hypothetical protein
MTCIILTEKHCNLKTVIENNKSIAVREFIYKINFKNISSELKNNYIKVNNKTYKIPDGYYDFCSLSEKLFEPAGVKITYNPNNLRVSLENKNVVIPRRLQEQLGLNNGEMNLSIYRNINICLGQLSFFNNLFDGIPSKILRSIPAPKGMYGDIVSHVFSPQFKKLQSTNIIHELDVFFTDNDGNHINIEEFTLVLEVI